MSLVIYILQGYKISRRSQWTIVTQVVLIQRGCRQGEPISPYLFVLCVEILAIMNLQNKNIIGISIGKTEHNISQYADDTEIMIVGVMSLRGRMDAFSVWW